MSKDSTGINGLDAVLYGGYPTGKTTLIMGDPGAGKTTMTLLFTYNILLQSKKVLYISMDEKPDVLRSQMLTLCSQGKNAKLESLFLIDASSQINQGVSGEFDMMLLIDQISYLKEKHQIQHIVIDSIQSIQFGKNNYYPSHELLQIFYYAKSNNITLLVTMGEGISDKYEMLAKFSVDCVIEVKQIIRETIMTRYLRVLKYRGSAHGTDFYPYSINAKGISLLPITNSNLKYDSRIRYVSSGIKKLDNLLGGKGIPLESTLMISGRSGTAKTSVTSKIAVSACESGLTVCYISFEESPGDLIKHTSSFGLNLRKHVENKKLIIRSFRSVEKGLEEHILTIIDLIEENKVDLVVVDLVVVDPITALIEVSNDHFVKNLLLRFVSYIKEHHLSAIFTELMSDYANDKSYLNISSLTDVWIRLRLTEEDGEFYRSLYVIKARGQAQSHQVKEIKISCKGIELLNPYVSDNKVVFESKKSALELKDKISETEMRVEQRKLEENIKSMRAQKKMLDKQIKLHLSQKNDYQKSRE